MEIFVHSHFLAIRLALAEYKNPFVKWMFIKIKKRILHKILKKKHFINLWLPQNILLYYYINIYINIYSKYYIYCNMYTEYYWYVSVDDCYIV